MRALQGVREKNGRPDGGAFTPATRSREFATRPYSAFAALREQQLGTQRAASTSFGPGGRLPGASGTVLGNQAVLRSLSAPRPVIQTKLVINQPGDVYEQEADRVAEQVMRMPERDLAEPSAVSGATPSVQRKCSCGGTCEDCRGKQNEWPPRRQLYLKRIGTTDLSGAEAPPIVDEVLRSPGQPLDASTRAFMEARLGRDFSRVRIHTGDQAAGSAAAVGAHAFTAGENIIFGGGRYAPGNHAGRGLIAHELTHVVQQSRLSPFIQRVPVAMGPGGYPGSDADAVAEREYGGGPAPKAHKCGRPSWCPPGFCDPYGSQKLAEYYRAKNAWWIMLGISKFVDSRVVPLWNDYLWGGSAPRNLTADFGKDFTNSPTTRKTTEFLRRELDKSIRSQRPSVPYNSHVVLDLTSLIGPAITQLNAAPPGPHRMNFNIPNDIPGNIAGDLGKDQTACPAGAKPSPFNDERHAKGSVNIERKADATLFVTPNINYLVKDTIDLCPGDCGTTLERFATVPLSQFEATGISGDVPFTVEFPAPDLGPFAISAPLPSSAPPPAVKGP